ncbi:MAG TPA: M20/M25/M40 family metallo-hydrolase [Gemmatimonadales bacterium]|nr:M20/M25/M40 family metallo-hydrolase [Gemmatimonadales bacterium]
MLSRIRSALLLSSLGFAAPVTSLPAQSGPGTDSLATTILEQLVEIPTTDSAGNTRRAADAMAHRLLAAGFPAADVKVIEVPRGTFALVARYRGKAGSTSKPILMLAHLDVVPARREDWSFDPFVFRELDGWYYGRGVLDNKAGDAILVANFIRWRREKWTPSRDLIIALTGDEETASASIQGLLAEHRDLIDAAYALNTDAGGGELRDGKPVAFSVQTAEKVYQTYHLEATSPGGHSSVPMPGNAIYRLSQGLLRLAHHDFPVGLNETTRSYFERSAPGAPPAVGRDMRAAAAGDTAAARRLSAAEPVYNALLHTTCVATRLAAGHADNALPQSAVATVNCRVLPGEALGGVQAALERVLADTAIHVTAVERSAPPGPASPLRADVMQPIERLVARMWPGAVVVPEMSTGATDGSYVRGQGIPTYGVSAVFDVIDDIRAHGRDERIGVKAFHDAGEFWNRLVRELAK